MALNSEAIVQTELNHAAIGESPGDPPELGRVDVVAGGVQGGMIEDICRRHAKLDAVLLGDRGFLLKTVIGP